MKIILALLLSLCCNPLFATDSDSLKIVVKDSRTKQPLEFSIITLIRQKDKGVIGITDSSGIVYLNWRFINEPFIIIQVKGPFYLEKKKQVNLYDKEVKFYLKKERISRKALREII